MLKGCALFCSLWGLPMAWWMDGRLGNDMVTLQNPAIYGPTKPLELASKQGLQAKTGVPANARQRDQAGGFAKPSTLP